MDDSCEGDDYAVVSGGFLEARSDTSELLELGKAAFDEMELCLELLVERVFEDTSRIIGYDGQGTLVDNSLSQSIGIIGGVGHDDLSGQSLDQGGSLRRISFGQRSA